MDGTAGGGEGYVGNETTFLYFTRSFLFFIPLPFLFCADIPRQDDRYILRREPGAVYNLIESSKILCR